MRQIPQAFDSRQIMNNHSFEIFHYKNSAASEIAVHHHDFYELLFFYEGDMEYWIEGRTYSLRPGDLLLIHPMQLHHPTPTRPSQMYERTVLWINTEYLSQLTDNDNLCECFEKARRENAVLLRPSPVLRVTLAQLLDTLVREFYYDGFAASLYAQGIFLQFMAEVNRLALSESIVKNKTFTDNLGEKAIQYIDAHFTEELSLEILAEHFYVSKYHLSHRFKEACGVSVHRYLLLKRLIAAKAMLGNGIPPGDVYTACGFQDYTAFFRAFKQEYGFSPRQVFEKNK